MNIKPKSDMYSGFWNINTLNETFTAEYKKCKCLNGEPSLRCSDEFTEYCDPDGCDENYEYDIGTHSCIPASVALTCTKTEHYVKDNKKCEPNVCYCNLGEVSENCFEHNSHICKPSSCISGTEPIEVTGGSECVKKCSKILEMDSSWYQPDPNLQVYWQIMKSDENNLGYNFFDAMNYCKSLGSFVSLPTQPDLFYKGLYDLDSKNTTTTTWIGLSKFGIIPDDLTYEIQSASAPFKWDRNKGHRSSGVFLIDLNGQETKESCVEISIVNSTFITEPVNCDKRQNFFICEYSLSSLEETTTLHQHYLDNPGRYHNIYSNYTKNEVQNYEQFLLPDYEFRYYSERKSWDEAFETCKNDGFYLAEITELSLLNSVRDFIGESDRFWIGGKSDEIGGDGCIDQSQFYWATSNKFVIDTNQGQHSIEDHSHTGHKGCCLEIDKSEKSIKGGDILAILFSIPNDTLYRVGNGLKMPKNDL